MANLKNVIYLSNEDYETLVSTGTVTIDGTTITYSDNDVYITPDVLASAENAGLMSAADKIKLDSSTPGNYVTLDTAQTITGKKNFTDEILINNNQLGYSSGFYFNGLVRPYSSDAYDIGTSTHKWKDAYFSGDVKANTISVSSIKDASGNSIAGLSYSIAGGADITAEGHITLYGDADGSNTHKPADQTNFSDLDTTLFNTGVCLYDTEGQGEYKISYPAKNGVFALTSDIPSVGNGTLTIQKNSSTVASFTANQSGNTTANITVPTALTTTAASSAGRWPGASYASDVSHFVTPNDIYFWNGAVTGTTSYLAYCNQGAFGSIITHSASDYLPISGGTMTGTINTLENTGAALNFRGGNGDYFAGIAYRTNGNEAVCFENKNSVTSWIFRTYNPISSTSSWDEVTPSLQIKNQRVTINKFIPNGQDAAYNLDVNGSANATTVTVNAKVTMQYNSNEDCIDFIFN